MSRYWSDVKCPNHMSADCDQCVLEISKISCAKINGDYSRRNGAFSCDRPTYRLPIEYPIHSHICLGQTSLQVQIWLINTRMILLPVLFYLATLQETRNSSRNLYNTTGNQSSRKCSTKIPVKFGFHFYDELFTNPFFRHTLLNWQNMWKRTRIRTKYFRRGRIPNAWVESTWEKIRIWPTISFWIRIKVVPLEIE